MQHDRLLLFRAVLFRLPYCSKSDSIPEHRRQYTTKEALNEHELDISQHCLLHLMWYLCKSYPALHQTAVNSFPVAYALDGFKCSYSIAWLRSVGRVV